MTIYTLHPIAADSADHLYPLGTANDNSTNPAFNAKLYKWMGQSGTVLDIGCAGGGFVEACNRDGYLAVGIDGSDYSRKLGREAWGRIRERLFTADAARPFDLMNGADRVTFDVITAWEVMEHIDEADLRLFMGNVRKHLRECGRFIASIATFAAPPHHITIRDKQWWLRAFADLGWENDAELVAYFGSDWIRGRADDDRGFHVCLKCV